MLLWDFAHEMWEHQNSVLHDTNLAASRAMCEAEIDDAITKLYDKVDTYSADSICLWLFDCASRYVREDDGSSMHEFW
jgi:hypothetical protein